MAKGRHSRREKGVFWRPWQEIWVSDTGDHSEVSLALGFIPRVASSLSISLISELADNVEGLSWTWSLCCFQGAVDKKEHLLRRFARLQAPRLHWNHNWGDAWVHGLGKVRTLSAIMWCSWKCWNSQPRVLFFLYSKVAEKESQILIKQFRRRKSDTLKKNQQKSEQKFKRHWNLKVPKKTVWFSRGKYDSRF